MSNTEYKLYFAHSRNDEPEKSWQTLIDHLRNVSNLCAEFSKEFGYENWGKTIGLLHDAGKVSSAFQSRLQGSAISVDHAVMGAKFATENYPDGIAVNRGIVMAFDILGHHGGIPNGIKQNTNESRTPLKSRLDLDNHPASQSYEEFKHCFLDYLKQTDTQIPSSGQLELLPLEQFALECKEKSIQPQTFEVSRSIFSTSVITRMLFSCLVDADYLDTEFFVDPEKSHARKTHRSSISELNDRIVAHMDLVTKTSEPSLVNEARNEVLNDCREAAESDPGIFTLSVPTGGGKTLASMSFALAHAKKNHMTRVIYAIPFTSIVEQNAKVFREVLGETNVLEHHSDYDFDNLDEETALQRRLAIENWNSPIVVTTNVQLLESLFSNKPSKCRKLHNVANSVIVFDEAQTLPDELLTVTLAMLEELVEDFNVTVVLCTATQPALDEKWPFSKGEASHEIVKDKCALESKLSHRVKFNHLGKVKTNDLVESILKEHQALCIVDTRKKARLLYEEIAFACKNGRQGENHQTDGVLHLSANMTPLHRSKTIEKIRNRLKNGERCIVVSTQLIEAGVDVDFPTVFRELAGIDSIMQAAGRCNREGKRDQGIVHIFELVDDSTKPIGMVPIWLNRMKELSRRIINERGIDLDDESIREFFNDRYNSLGKEGLDSKNLFSNLTSAQLLPSFEALAFEECANDYKVISDETIPVFIPWGDEGMRLYEKLRDGVEEGVPASRYARELQKSSVSINRYTLEKFLSENMVDGQSYSPIYISTSILGGFEIYDDNVGLKTPEEGDLNGLIF
jgi:CRISPR-associated endonuclease/helicase Cas3